MEPIHNRMPVILAPAVYDLWLDPAVQEAERLQPLIRPFPADEMTAYPVSTVVNNPRNETEKCVDGVEPGHHFHGMPAGIQTLHSVLAGPSGREVRWIHAGDLFVFLLRDFVHAQVKRLRQVYAMVRRLRGRRLPL